MTSKHFFFKVMREDLRHKIWTIALSVLGSFLLMTVVWMVWRSNQREVEKLVNQGVPFFGTNSREYAIGEAISYFKDAMSLLGGLLAVIGAIITGLFGFRYVFHKNMVDAYHSLPVKRSTLFAALYVDGFLIWFVPFVVFYLPTVALASGYIGKLGGTGQDIGSLIRTAAITMVVLITAFLLVYGLVLTAVMLSGNILNTLVSMMILGIGLISMFGIVYAFFGLYMDRFYDVRDWSAMAHVSPLIAAPALLYWRAELDGGLGAFCGKAAVDFILAAALGWCAWLLYKKRASELAEQGIRNRTAAGLMKSVAGFVAGMCGWMLFMLITGKEILAWGIFGLLFGGILCFGVLNIIFSMDFKAFFTHKRQLAAILAAAMAVCFAFQWDWFGYDDYLPAKDKIAEMAVYAGDFTNRYIQENSEDSPLQKMHYQDADAIYSFLERATGEEPKRDYTGMPTKVTLQNGRSYYRWYRIDREEVGLLWPLLTDEEYLKYAFCIDREMIRDCEEFELRREGRREKFLTKDCPQEAFYGIVEAYNQDVLENPEGAFLGEGKRLVYMSFDIKDSDGRNTVTRISVYDTMERTVSAMRDAGLGEWVSEPDTEAIASITLHMESNYGRELTAEEKIDIAREYYGVYENGGKQEDSDKALVEDTKLIPDNAEEWWIPAVEITDRAGIEELCALMDYAEPGRSDRMFQEGSVELFYTDREGNSHSCYLPRGALPEKYILMFGDCLYTTER